MSSLLLKGPNEISLGILNPGDSISIVLEFFPLLTGLHKITGLRIVEAGSLGVVKEVDSLCEVLVQ